MQKKINVQRMHQGAKPTPASFFLASHGQNFYIRIVAEDNLDLILQAHAETMLNTFEPMLKAMRGNLTPGVIRGDAPAQAEYFSTLTLEDITANLPLSQKLALLIRRFQDNPDMADLTEALIADYKSLIGQEYKPHQRNPLADKLAQDVELVEPIANQLFRNGVVIYGAQSEVARALGITNAGVTNRQRIAAVLQYLQDHCQAITKAKAA